MLRDIEHKLQRKTISFGIIALMALIVYSNSFTVPFILDDFGSISSNYSIRNPLAIATMWKFYSNRFILYYTLSLNYVIHDGYTAGYHIVNLIIHAFNGMIIFLIFYNLLGLKHFEGRLPGIYRNIISAICAVIFVTHPIQVNAVTYIVQRTASLASMFYFLAVLYFIKYRTRDKIRYFALTVLFTILAMFTKENTVTIPFMLIAIELVFFLKDGKTSWKKRALFLSILLLTAPIIPCTNLFLHGFNQSDPHVTFKASTSMDRMHYFYTEMNVIILYIRLLFIPDRQNFDYSNDFTISRTIWENNSYISLAVLLVIGIIGLLNFRRNKLVCLGILWFFIGLSVESSFVSIKDVYFEHRLYLPLAGFIMFITGLVFTEYRGFSRLHLFKKPLLFFIVLSVFMISMNSALTLKRNYIYGDSMRLWSDAVSKAPNSDRAHSALGGSYMDKYDDTKDKKYLDMAESELKNAIRLRSSNSTAHCNLAKVYYMKGEYDECILEAKESLRYENSAFAYNNLGLAYEKQGRIDDAINAFLAGYKADKNRGFILRGLGNLYYKKKDYKNARFYYEEFLKQNKSNKEIRKKLDEVNKYLESVHT